jgi:hypothetical protein
MKARGWILLRVGGEEVVDIVMVWLAGGGCGGWWLECGRGNVFVRKELLEAIICIEDVMRYGYNILLRKIYRTYALISYAS